METAVLIQDVESTLQITRQKRCKKLDIAMFYLLLFFIYLNNNKASYLERVRLLGSVSCF